MKTPGQTAYEEDVRIMPNYPDGALRKSWDQLSMLAKRTWEQQPTVRARRPAAAVSKDK
ncbi:hypothetical protein [Bradyrhizobium sp. SZCCHNS1054]|uniref:hypothetical protein n=1 Tax=Bradyrhizobium sp. SZCCHNS1054 TaxID=3057301 RepID=UPI0029160BC5|nr:hypothetical protein [Bradyrhizobium sp. SZCCHNS1054]